MVTNVIGEMLDNKNVIVKIEFGNNGIGKNGQMVNVTLVRNARSQIYT